MRGVWGKKKCIKVIGEETRRKSLLGKPRRKWENNIKMCLEGVAWIILFM
jgi:hypothetical protein